MKLQGDHLIGLILEFLHFSLIQLDQIIFVEFFHRGNFFHLLFLAAKKDEFLFFDPHVQKKLYY